MRKTPVLSGLFVLTLLPFLISAVAGVPIVDAAEDSHFASKPVHNDHFVVKEALGWFAGDVCVGSFNASNGYWVQLNISSFGSDAYEVIVTITSANHGELFHAVGKTFTQTVILYHEDSYNVTIAKRAFYSTVTVNGKIDVYHLERHTPTPEPTIAPPSSPAPSQKPTSNTQSGHLPPVVVTVAAVSIAIIGVYLLIHLKKRKRQS